MRNIKNTIVKTVFILHFVVEDNKLGLKSQLYIVIHY